MEKVKRFVWEFWLFGLKLAYACLFGGFLLGVIIVTKVWYPFESLHRYDFIFLSAVVFQLFLLVTKLETLRESLVIVIFHIVATLMELFKTSDVIGSWTYPEDYVLGIGNVPLFTGFMYSAVGSYIARIWRIFDFRFDYYPRFGITLILALLVYANFFTHHFIVDFRWIILALIVGCFYKSNIYFRVDKQYRTMPLLLGWFLVALFIWFAENISTYASVWVYPNQRQGWQLVSFSKLIAWYLLMYVSFVLVTCVNTIRKISD